MSKYVYPYSRESAENDGVLDIWQDSRSENIACAKSINNEISLNSGGMPLDDAAARRVIGQFGIDRVNWVLAATVQHQSKDDLFSQTNMDWAKQFFMTYLKKEISEYGVDCSPAVLDELVDQVRKEYNQLNLLDYTHCLPDSGNMDYKDRVLVLRPTNLNDEHKTPDNQLVIADIGGNGCSPTASGRKVMGHYLIDGEACVHQRSDFVGIVMDDYLPQWVKDALEQWQGTVSESNANQTMCGY